MVLKVSSFHVYTHQDDAQDTIENCAVCDVAIENQDLDFLFPSPQATVNSTFDYATYEQPVIKDLVVPSFLLRNSFFGRPPPGVL